MHRENREKEVILVVDDEDVSDCGEDDDSKRSISSESTCYDEVKVEYQMRQKQMHKQSTDFDIWRLFQVDDQNMKDIPNSESILEILSTNGLDGNFLFN